MAERQASDFEGNRTTVDTPVDGDPVARIFVLLCFFIFCNGITVDIPVDGGPGEAFRENFNEIKEAVCQVFTE